MSCIDRSRASATGGKRASSRKCETPSTEVWTRSNASNSLQMRWIPRPASVPLAHRLRGDARPPRSAAPGIAYGLTDDAWLANGPGHARASGSTTLDALGVQVVRFTVQLGPGRADRARRPDRSADPAYDWVDADARARRPSRARDRRRPATRRRTVVGERRQAVELRARRPRRRSRAFATAVAHEYPWVKQFQIWNEPNQARWLRPTSAPLYMTRLLNPAYTAIHAAIAGAKVAGGGTAPRGSTGGVSPVAWITGMHRPTRGSTSTRTTPIRSTRSARPRSAPAASHCTTVTMATLSRLERLVARVLPARAHLADRVRLPEQPARSHPRRHARAAGALRRRRRVRGVPRAARRPADPLPLPRRADARALPERPRHARQHAAGRRSPRSSCRSPRPPARARRRASGGSCAHPTSGSIAVLERRIGSVVAIVRARSA